MNLGNLESLAYSWPELILIGTAILIFVADLVVRSKEQLGTLALFGCAFALLASIGLRVPFSDTWLIHGLFGWGEGWLYSRMMIVDDFAVFFKVIFCLAAFATVWMSLGSNEVRGNNEGEYYGLVLASTVGMFYMASAANLLMAYLSLEFVSLTSYVLTGYLRQNRRSGEAALKYLIYGGVASGTMIYGMSWLYGLTGSLDYADINAALAQGTANPLTIFIAVLLILAGFGYKIAAVPFHMWAPDVYHGAPIPVTAFLSVGSKAAGFAILMRLFYPGLSQAVEGGNWQFLAGVDWPKLMLVICMVTMTLGNLAALQPAEREAPARLLEHRARRLHPHGLRRAERRGPARDALLPRHLLPDEHRRLPGGDGGRELDRPRGHRRVPWSRLARRRGAGGGDGHLPLLARRASAARRLHRQVLPVRRGGESSSSTCWRWSGSPTAWSRSTTTRASCGRCSSTCRAATKASSSSTRTTPASSTSWRCRRSCSASTGRR